VQTLSAWFYLKNNKKRAAILVVSFALYFVLLYGVQFFVDPTYYMERAVRVGTAKHMQMAYLNSITGLHMDLDESLWNADSEATLEEKLAEINRVTKAFSDKLLADSSEVDRIIRCNSYDLEVNSPAGDITISAPMVTKEELADILTYLNLTIARGRMPQNPGELVVDERILKNLGLQIGDTVYDKETVIVGTVKADYYFAAGMDYDDKELVNRFLVFLDQGTLPDLKAYFARYGITAGASVGEEKFSSVHILTDEVNAIALAEDSRKQIDQPMTVMSVTISIVMGLTLFFVYRLHVQDRYSEWCLYRSLGVSEQDVYFLAFREYLICLGIALLTAVLLGGGVIAVGAAFMNQRGMMFRILMPEVLFRMLAICVLMTGFLQLPVLAAMKKVKTIDAMEEE